MKKSIKNSLIIIVSLVIGYAAGVIIGYPKTSGNMGSGDVSKVSSFRKAITGPQYSAYEELLLADSLAMKQEEMVTETLAQTLQEFATLVDSSIVVAGDIPELSNEVSALREIRNMSDNAAAAGELAQASLDNLQKGGSDELGVSYEQASQNMYVAYLIVDSQIRTGREFAIAADQYYVKHPEYTDLASLRDSWAIFCCDCEMIKGNANENQFWANNTSAKLKEYALGQKACELPMRQSAHVIGQKAQNLQKTADFFGQKAMPLGQSAQLIDQKAQNLQQIGKLLAQKAQNLQHINIALGMQSQTVQQKSENNLGKSKNDQKKF